MNREKDLDSIPIDLITEIHSRLPAKSVARFRCVSKLWRSMLSHPYFSELFLTRSRARPRILFVLQQDDEWSFFSSPQPQNPHDNSFVVADFHMKFSQNKVGQFCGVTSGLVYFSHMQISKKNKDEAPMICNPRTGQYVILPKIGICKGSYIGYDPIDKQHKVLFMASLYSTEDHKILTLGSGNMCWRKLECSLTHHPWSQNICINGILYYLASRFDKTAETYDHYYVIVCFDVRSEKFKFTEIEFMDHQSEVINYKGKLGVISWRKVGKTILLHMWILEDVKKLAWSNYVYTLGDDAAIKRRNLIIAGVTTTGEIILSMIITSKPFYVYYFNPERNTLRKVHIHALDSGSWVYPFVDFVEDLNVNDSKQLKSSLANQLNIIMEWPEQQQHRHTPSGDLSNSGPSVI